MSTVSLTRAERARPHVAVDRAVASAASRGALAAVALLAAVLRFQGLGSMPVNPYYDAAVRSMGSSWHAFLVGAFNPNASVAVDKPPLDLWLQVASTKVFGFTPFALHLPEALASTAAVLLLYDLVRRGFGRTAGLASAAAFAVLPAEVMTARSDTMDAWMATLLVLAAWLVVRSAERGRGPELVLAGAVVGLAFETKLFEALVPVPALVLLFVLGSAQSGRARVRRLAGAGAAMVGVGLAWPLLFALSPPPRPYPSGSSDGTIWSTVFGFNGVGRLTGSSTHSAIDRLTPAGPARLVSAGPVHLDKLVGTSLVAALAFALAAVALGLLRRRSLGRLPFALAVAMGVWLSVGGGLLSFMSHVPTRYLEVLAPAIAGTFGIAVALVGTAAGAHSGGAKARASIALVAATAATLLFARGAGLVPIPGLIAALVALAALFAAGRRGTYAVAALVTALVAVVALAAPTSQSLALVRGKRSDGGALGAMAPRTVTTLSRYLTNHQGRARYEFAVAEAHLAAPLIVRDARPVLVLAGTPYHSLVGTQRLAAAVRAGSVRYVLLSTHVRTHPVRASSRARTSRGQMAAWVRTHGVDVSRNAGLGGYGALYRLTPQAGRTG